MTKRVVPRGGIVALLILSFALGLGGCGESLYDKDEAPPEKVDGDVVLQPGLYRMQVSIGGAASLPTIRPVSHRRTSLVAIVRCCSTCRAAMLVASIATICRMVR